MVSVQEYGKRLNIDVGTLDRNIVALVGRLAPYLKVPLPKPEIVNAETVVESQVARDLRWADETVAYASLVIDILLNSCDL
jgi:hypothetical protein